MRTTKWIVSKIMLPGRGKKKARHKKHIRLWEFQKEAKLIYGNRNQNDDCFSDGRVRIHCIKKQNSAKLI